MKYLKNYTYANYLLLDIFGVGATVQGATGLASTALTNEANKSIARETNETNIQIHEDDRAFNAEEAEKSRQFNAEEAEKARQFNAEEAEKARQWTSEESTMQRRKEAGLNTAITGQGGSSSSAPSASSPSASSSPASAPSAPNLVTPTMQAPDIASLVNSGVNLAKASSEIFKNKADAKQTLAETKETEERTRQLEMLNQFTPQMNKLLLAEKTLSNTEKAVMIEYNQQKLDEVFQQGFGLYIQNTLAVENFNLDMNKFLMLTEQAKMQLDQQAEMFLAEWERNHFDGSFKYGTSQTRKKGWHLGGDVGYGERKSTSGSTLNSEGTTTTVTGSSPSGTKSAHSDSFGRKTIQALSKLANLNGGIDGGYENTSSSLQIMQNEAYYQFAVEYQACLNGLKSNKYSPEQERLIRNRMRNLQLSVEGYQLFLRQLGKVKKMPSVMETLQDLEEQQQ